jgi:hypothetical protein
MRLTTANDTETYNYKVNVKTDNGNPLEVQISAYNHGKEIENYKETIDVRGEK